jgi:regulator of cell morphogenesis and NO signaling
MKFSTSDLVADVAAKHPATMRVLGSHGIDFCCAGAKPLGEACRDRSLDVQLLLRELEEHTQAPPLAAWRDWKEAPLQDLVAFILRRYHDSLKSELPRLEGVLGRVNEAHGDRLPRVLRPLTGLFHELVQDLEPHMMKEERVLFPMVLDLAQAQDARAHASWFHWGSVANPISVMELEHESVGSLLSRMREVTNDYELPSWACNSMRTLYAGLQTLEEDLKAHIHLENHVLHPRAKKLELELKLS